MILVWLALREIFSGVSCTSGLILTFACPIYTNAERNGCWNFFDWLFWGYAVISCPYCYLIETRKGSPSFFVLFSELSKRLCLGCSFCFVRSCLSAFDFWQFFLKQGSLSKYVYYSLFLAGFLLFVETISLLQANCGFGMRSLQKNVESKFWKRNYLTLCRQEKCWLGQ